MAVEACDKQKMMDDLDEDDEPLVFRRSSSSSSKQIQLNSESKKSLLQKHDQQLVTQASNDLGVEACDQQKMMDDLDEDDEPLVFRRSISSLKEVAACPKRSKVPWSYSEEVCLVKSWSAVTRFTTDPIVGNVQKTKTYWEKVAAYYNEARSDGSRARTGNQVKGHYYEVTPDVNLFAQLYNNFLAHQASWQSDDDVTDAALAKWRSTHKDKEFKYLHIWKISQASEKWAPQHKKSKNFETDSPSCDGGACIQPMEQ